MKRSESHPTRDQLAAFVHGQLTDDELRLMETHISECDTCCEELRQVPHDQLVGQLRSSAWDLGVRESADFVRDDVLANHSRYEVLRELGRGGMGVVYLAKHRLMGRTVALKVINPRLLQNQMAIERFRHEVQAAARLNHRNIVTAFDAEQAGESHFLVMEYVDGTDLATIVARQGRLPVVYACNYVMQAALGLQHAHEQGMVHRDVKPHNLMRTAAGTIKIMDFGLARLANPGDSETPHGLTAEGVTLGTPDYIAPEQARDARRADIRSDIYSLGCTLYYLLSANVPFPAGTAVEKVIAHVTADPIPIQQMRSDIPTALTAILGRMMARDPDDRFQTAVEVARALMPFSLPENGETPPALDTQIDVALQHVKHGTDTTSQTLLQSDEDFFIKDKNAIQPVTQQDVAQQNSLQLPVRKSMNARRLVALLVVGVVFVFAVVQFVTSSRDSNRSAPRQPLTITDQWVDLISQVEPRTQTVSGNWSRNGNELIGKAREWARIAILDSTPREYDFEVEFTRTSGEHSVALIFPAGSGDATLELDAWGKHLSGLQLINGEDLRSQQTGAATVGLKNGKRYVARVEVRELEIRAFLDDTLVTTYRGDGANLRPLEGWKLVGPSRLGVGAFNSDITVHHVRIRTPLR
ncbi:MAG: protein kinase [Planctomycetaceae bacterium]